LEQLQKIVSQGSLLFWGTEVTEMFVEKNPVLLYFCPYKEVICLL